LHFCFKHYPSFLLPLLSRHLYQPWDDLSTIFASFLFSLLSLLCHRTFAIFSWFLCFSSTFFRALPVCLFAWRVGYQRHRVHLSIPMDTNGPFPPRPSTPCRHPRQYISRVHHADSRLQRHTYGLVLSPSDELVHLVQVSAAIHTISSSYRPTKQPIIRIQFPSIYAIIDSVSRYFFPNFKSDPRYSGFLTFVLFRVSYKL
jgi:hypothetical protein